jgi:uncharacterized protein YndB with AHSA1/START domain
MNQPNNAGNRLKVTATNEIYVPSEEVFNAWLDPEILSQWMYGPDLRDEKIIHIKTDPREGGHFTFLVERQGMQINHIGTYLEVQPYNKLVFTWGIEGESVDESIVYIDITPTEKGCIIELTHELDPKWEAYISRTKNAWELMLNKLKEVLTKH